MLAALSMLALLWGCGRPVDVAVRDAAPASTATTRVTAAGVKAVAPPEPGPPTAALEPTPRPTPPPTPTPAATPDAIPDATPTPEPIRVRTFAPVQALVVTDTVSRASPSMSSRAVRELAAGTTVSLAAEERGENWIIGDQDWVPLSHDWERVWYRLDDGSYLYRAFVFLPDGAPVPSDGGAERYVIVDLDGRIAWAMSGATIVRAMPITTGKPGFETPTGTFYVLAGGRVLNERMTSQRAGFDDPNDRYDVERVLYTQYFAEGGFALHLNYWQPESVFGSVETSHGCVGLALDDAQFLWLFSRTGTRVVVRHGGGPQVAPPAAIEAPAHQPPPPTPAPVASSPTPSPSAEAPAVRVFAVQDGPPRAPAIVAARAGPGVTCSLAVQGATGSRREVPGSTVADAAGWLEWTWTIEADAPPGKGAVIVTCPGGTATADFTVR